MSASRLAGAGLVAAGAAMLAARTGFLDWRTLWRLVDWWPLLLILWGVALLFRGPASAAVTALTVVLATGVVAALAGRAIFIPWGAPVRTVALEQSLPGGVTSGEVRINFGAGRLEVSGGAPGFARGSLELAGPGPGYEFRKAGSRATLVLGTGRQTVGVRGPQPLTWTVQLTEAVPLDVVVNVGAAKARLDLSRLELERLEVSSGAAALEVLLGSRTSSRVELNAGAAGVTVAVPRAAGVRVRMAGVAVGHNLGQLGFERRADGWVSPNYDTAGVRVEIGVNAAATRFTLEWR